MKTPDGSNPKDDVKVLRPEEKALLDSAIKTHGAYISDVPVTNQEAFYDLRASFYDQQNERPYRVLRREVLYPFYRDQLKGILPPELTYLDFGCATGTATLQFLDSIKDFSTIKQGYALDISQEMVDRAKQNLAQFEILKGDARKINFNGKLDLITSFFHVLCHLTDTELQIFFQNAERALKPGGVLCFDVLKRLEVGELGYSQENIDKGQKYMLYHSAKTNDSVVSDEKGNPIIGTDRMFTEEEIRDFAKNAGLEVREVKKMIFTGPDTSSGLAEYAVILRKPNQ